MIQEALGIAVELAVVGMSVVFLALVLLVFLLTGFKRINARLERPKEVVDQIDTVKTPTAAPASGELTPDVAAAIMAAIAVATTKKVRIRRIRYRGAHPEPSWSRQGRVTIMGSRVTKR